MSTSPGPSRRSIPAGDLLRWPIAGPLLRWRRLRTLTQIGLLVVAVAIVSHGLLGPDLGPKNLATVLTWIHYRRRRRGAHRPQRATDASPAKRST